MIQALVEISDSEFQQELIRGAQKDGKLSLNYQVPEHARDNTPQRIISFILQHKKVFPPFPFGTDFTETELVIGRALGKLRDASLIGKLKTFARGILSAKSPFKKELERMELWKPSGLKERLTQALMIGALAKNASV